MADRMGCDAYYGKGSIMLNPFCSFLSFIKPKAFLAEIFHVCFLS